MLTYEIDGSILTLRVSGMGAPAERRDVYSVVRADTRVPNDALVLVDDQRSAVHLHDYAVRERVRALVDQLGSKLGKACAILTPIGPGQSGIFQETASDFGLVVRCFRDEATARKWLNNPDTSH
jgi:hypothetical protein